MLQKVDGRSDILKDAKTGALLPSSTRERDEYLSKKAMMNARRNQEEEAKKMRAEIDELKESLNEIKTLLKKALE